ncbi:uncharacterized protein LOC125677012 isoform X1 [Ostrea edulis]|nr:uncharacterized protein LOC125677012 isoform X1 [Ostrea edulis]
MDPACSTQSDGVYCDMCGTGEVQSHCELCIVNLCMKCVGEHLSEPYKRHTVVLYRQRSLVPRYPKCPNHPNINCEFYCQKCRVVVCPICVSSGEHHSHTKINVLQKSSSKTKRVEADLKKSTAKLKPTHKEIAPGVKIEKANVEEAHDKLTRHLPTVPVDLPSIFPETIRTEDIHPLFDSLSELSITGDEKNDCAMKTPEVVQYVPPKPEVAEPEVITTINTGYFNVYGVCCVGDDKIWTRGNDPVMKHFKLKGHKLLNSIQTSSGNDPLDIAVTKDGYLVYTDSNTQTVNIVKKKKVQELIRLGGWMPLFVCNTLSGDLLVTMCSDNKTQCRVVRYTDFTETQSIQFDDKGKPLYSCGCLKYISENRNLDICVADWKAKAVVVVNQSGKLRFRYTGHPSNMKQSFDPVGIVTDSQSHILIADCNNNRIHILDQDGQFLRYIDTCGLQLPSGLCLDSKDNLFVAERAGETVKKIRYQY